MKYGYRLLCVIVTTAACRGALANTSFFGDWESGTVTGTGNTNWHSIQSVAPNRFTLINDGARPGTYARVEVRKGDDPSGNCCDESDRAEVLHMQNSDGSILGENLASGTQQFGFSVKFDADWQPIVDPDGGSFGIFLQLHGPDVLSSNPALAFSATDQIYFNMSVGDLDRTKIVKMTLANGTLNSGKWIDFQLTVRFAADDTGFVRILRRDEGEASFAEVLSVSETPTLQYRSSHADGSVLDHYWKHGLYRTRQEFTSVLYLDGMTRQVSAVPEPQTYALLLFGLGLLRVSIRRHSIHQQVEATQP